MNELEPSQDKKSGCIGLTVSTSLQTLFLCISLLFIVQFFFLNACNKYHGIHGKPQTKPDWDTQMYVNAKKRKKKALAPFNILAGRRCCMHFSFSDLHNKLCIVQFLHGKKTNTNTQPHTHADTHIKIFNYILDAISMPKKTKLLTLGWSRRPWMGTGGRDRCSER